LSAHSRAACLPVLDAELTPELADEASLTIPPRKLPRHGYKIARLGQLKVEFGEPVVLTSVRST
jgi:hypothetical protein